MKNELVHTVLYTCVASHKMDSDELAAILEISRINNAKRGITGILFYKNREFLQLLEGEETVINKLLETISKDDRHSGLVILLKDNLPRMFSEWSMNFANLQDVVSGQGSNTQRPLEQAPWTVAEINKAPLRVRKLLVNFGAA